MTSADHNHRPERDVRTERKYWGNRVLSATLGVVIVLLGITNYLALTDDSFRNWTVQYTPSGFKAPGPAVDAWDAIRSARAAAREQAQTREIGALRRSLTAMTVDALALRKSNAHLVVTARATSARLAVAEKNLLAGVAAAERLGSRMKTRTGKNVARQIATLPGKVLPAVGATIVVASTALDLRDLCDGMRDIAVLNRAVGLPALDDRDVCGVHVGSVLTVVADARQNVTAAYTTALHAAGLKASSPLRDTGPASRLLAPAPPLPTPPPLLHRSLNAAAVKYPGNEP